METLRDIADEFLRTRGFSNKTQNPHNYVCLYESLFRDYRASATKVVEIGVCRGASLRLWYRYFYKAHVYGLDIDVERIPSLSDCGGRASAHKIDQSSAEQLRSFANEHGPLFDIVIDDGSHRWSDQISTFETLFPYVREGGLYVIEDTDTSYMSPLYVDRGFDVGDISCMEYFKNIADELNLYGSKFYEERPGKAMYADQMTEHQRTIEWLMFSRAMIVLKKRAVRDVPVWGT